MPRPAEPPLRLPSVAAAFWWTTVVLGWSFAGYAAWQLVTTPSIDLAPAFVMTAALAIVLELLPLMQGRRHNPQGVVMSTAFVCAMIFMWGPWPAVVMVSVASLASDLRAGKAWWKVLFNPAQYAVTAVAAGGVAALLGTSASLTHPLTTFRPQYLLWMLAAWLTWTVVNFALVAGVLTGPATFVENFTEDFRHEVMLTFAVLAISPLVLVVASHSWLLLPLLMAPLLLLYQTGQIAVDREREAGHDALTGLPNRLTLGFELDEALARHEREGVPFAFVLIDLNDFKLVNDTLGHQVGDAMLARMAERLRYRIRPGDCIARLGGDEFAVLVSGVDAAGALAVADRLRQATDDAIVIDSISLEIGFSVGIALCPDHGVDATTLMRRADVAMYIAKARRTGVEVYDANRDEHSADHLELVGELRNALAGDGVRLHYQPKLTAGDRTPIGFEALVRWTHPTRGSIAPDLFVPLAERSGVMPMLTARVIQLAIEQSVAWQRLGVAVPVAVNVSPTDLTSDGLVPLVAALLERYQMAPELLVLEITERVSTNTLDDAARCLQQLRELGVRISLDDFGTGYSSLARLSLLDVDEIKIDRVFVAAMSESDSGVSIVRAMVDLAHALGLPVIAEGVETDDQWHVLDELGCDAVQGWQVAMPMPADEATEWLRATAGTSLEIVA